MFPPGSWEPRHEEGIAGHKYNAPTLAIRTCDRGPGYGGTPTAPAPISRLGQAFVNAAAGKAKHGGNSLKVSMG